MLYDIYSSAYSAAEGLVTKHDVHTKAKAHLTSVLTEDPLAHACSKVGCNTKDIKDHFNKAHATVQQVKAQAYEHGAKASDHLQTVANAVVTKIETHVPSYKGVLPKSFVDLVLVGLYAVFVLYITYFIALFVLSTSLSIFCCVFCCGCCRGGKAAPKAGKNSGKKGAADAKATLSKPAVAAKAKGKK